MITLFDRILLFILGAFIICMNCDEYQQVIFCLYGVILTGITLCFSECKKSKAELLIYIILLAVAVPVSYIASFMGLIIYSYVYRYLKNVKSMWYISTVMVILVAANLLINRQEYLFWILISIVLSVLMAYKSGRLMEREKTIRRLRDDSMEKNIILTEKNKYLLENQENEIHIAILTERNRISKEIHDNVGHLLSRSILQLGAILAVNKDKTLENMLIPTKDTLNEAMNSIRESVHDLHNESFDLEAAAKKILEELSDFEVKFLCEISVDANKNVKYAFLTILKEAVTNIRKHCDGDRVEVIIRELDNYYQMVIEDNGEKIRNKKSNATYGINAGIGIKNMEDRVKSLSGIFNISYQNGFRIFISIPKEVA